MITRTCQYCGKDYQTFPSIRLLYCDKVCADKAKIKRHLKPCAVCGAEFWEYPSRTRQYCSKSCARTALNRTDANPSYQRDISGEKNPMHGISRMGADNPMYGRRKKGAPQWKGGRKVRKDGYILVVAPDDHPYPADQHVPSGLKYILEHRYVMEQHIGRYLTPKEIVHHIDGNPSNNAIENLQLFATQADHLAIGHNNGPRYNNGDRVRSYGANWSKQRAAALARDLYQCQECGATSSANSSALDVHHIRRFTDFHDYHEANQLANLVTLCSLCHVRRDFPAH